MVIAAAFSLTGVKAVAGTLSLVEQGRWVHVSQVFDGDTFRTDDSEKVRLLGINAPEIAHNDEPGQPLGKQAKILLTRLIGGKTVKLRLDKDSKDTYGRILAQVYLRNGDWVNAMLVREGMAYVYTFPPNFRWTPALIKAEQEAQPRHLGIWKNERFRILKAREAGGRFIGQFRIVQGKVTHPGSWRFRLGRLNISIPRKYRQWFDGKPLPAAGKHVRVRGTIRAGKGDRLYLALHSPYDIDILDKD